MSYKVTLVTEKYVQELQQVQMESDRRHERKRACGDYAAFAFGMAVIVGCVLVAEQIPNWIPGAIELFESRGVFM